jgi:spore maturation protein CgeB
MPALRNLGHQLVFFESFNRNTYKDFADLNRQLLEKVQAEKPDIILFVLMGYEIWLETLQLLREGSNAILINWSTDDSWKYEQFSRFVAPVFHVYATTYSTALEKSKRDGMGNFVLTQWAANSENLAEPVPASQCRYSVSFIGSRYGNRPRWVEAIKKTGIHVECFGYGWSNGSIAADDIPKIMRDSFISLNFGDSGMMLQGVMPGRSPQIKARVFEVPGAGGCLLTEYVNNLERFYRVGEEIAVYKTVQDLVEKIRQLVKHPEERDRIAVAGYIRTRNEHTYEKRFDDLLDIASKLKNIAPDVCHGIDFEKYSAVEKKHKAGIVLKIVKQVLLMPCVLIWGRRRGSRAARRLMFELSWRLVGKKTYTVSGWPGRMFYKES